MAFSTTYSPVTSAFTSLSNGQLDEFYRWFMTNLPYCIEELMQLVRTTDGFENWSPDYKPDSLDTLGGWFSKKVRGRDRSQEEMSQLKAGMTKPVEVASWELTDDTKSLAVYIGMYYGQTAVENNAALKWEQQLGSKQLADYGQPIVTGGGAIPINPVRIAHAFACGSIDGTKSADHLRKAYDYWSKLTKPK